MHPEATAVLDLKAFYFLEQAIPDMQTEILPAYLAAAEGVSPNIKVLEWWDKQEELPHWTAACQQVLLCQPAIIFSCLKVFLVCCRVHLVMTRAHYSKICNVTAYYCREFFFLN